MINKNKITLIILAVYIVLFLATGSSYGKTKHEEEIKGLSFKDISYGKDISIESVDIIDASEKQPKHCMVKGKLWPDDAFVIKLPVEWNGRLYQTGNGGAAGRIDERSMERPLMNGYATASGSGGHVSSKLIDWSFGYPPDDPLAKVRLEDYFHGSVHRVNAFARQLIKAYYGVDPSYVYYDGYSTGGRQGLMEAQRYPEDFDGILAGGAPFPFTKRTLADTWGATQLLGDSYVPRSKLPLLADAVLKECDGIDGVVDGFIEDPRQCTFNALTDLPSCPDGNDGPGCFTEAQRQAIYNIYDGVRDSNGQLLFKGASFSTETIMKDGNSAWELLVPAVPGGSDTAALGLGSGFVRLVGLPPEKGGPDWDWKTFDVDTDWDIVRSKWSIHDSDDPDLLLFKEKGGKLIYYHGWADALCWADPAPDYYDKVVQRIGSLKKTQQFFKMYMVPGMTHFPGGPSVFDRYNLRVMLFDALVEWVEKNKEPGVFTGARPSNPATGWRAISRSVCPYPQVSKYKGSGSPDDASNFTCQTPQKGDRP